MKRIYWWVKKPHCDNHRTVMQVDGVTAYVCEHYIRPSNDGCRPKGGGISPDWDV